MKIKAKHFTVVVESSNPTSKSYVAKCGHRHRSLENAVKCAESKIGDVFHFGTRICHPLWYNYVILNQSGHKVF